MATARLILRRNANKDNLYPVVILISQKSTYTEMVTRISIDKKYWENGVIKRGCPQVDNVREANMELAIRLNEVLEFIERLEDSNRIDVMSAKQIADYVRKG